MCASICVRSLERKTWRPHDWIGGQFDPYSIKPPTLALRCVGRRGHGSQSAWVKKVVMKLLLVEESDGNKKQNTSQSILSALAILHEVFSSFLWEPRKVLQTTLIVSSVPTWTSFVSVSVLRQRRNHQESERSADDCPSGRVDRLSFLFSIVFFVRHTLSRQSEPSFRRWNDGRAAELKTLRSQN